MASPANNAAASMSTSVECLLSVIDESIIRQYQAKLFSPVVISQGAGDYLSIKNTHEWAKIKSFLPFLAETSQQPVPQALNTVVPSRIPPRQVAVRI
ncbi:hypothetical protein M422DRAFT_270695 [Sphaerobolus stellatus SS14]|uniref:Uncharacterized protein n=1 Tax=Sphaerobolus stellatus (strain SS14) TaxID=990650 RepID=A0A0C9US70_SPHS4|nr:hypothetical protein M422DRAFT_270695 [Sphaerobolus stellatus SS14]